MYDYIAVHRVAEHRCDNKVAYFSSSRDLSGKFIVYISDITSGKKIKSHNMNRALDKICILFSS